MSNKRDQGAVARHARLSLLAVAGAAILVACGKPAVDYEASRNAIQPVARVELKVAKVEPGNRTGEEIYGGVCTTCHAAGTLGAPLSGDAGQWAPRIATGLDAMVAVAIAGKGQMPARGGMSDLTDEEVRRTVIYMANQAGASFSEEAAPAAAAPETAAPEAAPEAAPAATPEAAPAAAAPEAAASETAAPAAVAPATPESVPTATSEVPQTAPANP